MQPKLQASTKLYLLVFITSFFIIAIGLYGIAEMNQLKKSTQTLYTNRVICLQQLTTIRYSYSIGILSSVEQAQSAQLSFPQAEKEVDDAQKVITANWNAYLLTYFTPEEKQLAEQASALMDQSTGSIEKLKTILAQKDTHVLNHVINNELYPTINPAIFKINELINLQVRISKEVYKNSIQVYTNSIKKSLLLILLSLIFVIPFSFYLVRNIKYLIASLYSSNVKITESEEKYRSLIEHAGDAIFMVAEDSSIIDVNQSACELLGYTCDEVKKMKAKDVYPTNEFGTAPIEWDLLKKNKTFLNEGRLQRKDGTIVEVEISRKIFADGQGYLAIVRDITNRKKAEEKLKQSEARLKEAQAVAHMGGWEIDMVNHTHVWSDESYKILGVNKNEITPSVETLMSFIYPEDRNMAQNEINDTLITHTDSYGKFRFIPKGENQIRYAYMEWRFEFDNNKNPIRLYGIFQDITERTEADENLKALEAKISEDKLKKQQEITDAVIAAQEKERAFLGEELHDNINQILATSNLYMEMAITDKDVQKNKLMVDSKTYLLTAMEEIRKLSKSLLPPSLEGNSLLATLNELIENIKHVKKINFITEWENIDESLIEEKMSLAIFRIVQEQFNNILKYANAQTVFVSLKQDVSILQLRIKDDGIGFDTTEKRKGIGLKNITSRTELLNGELSINSKPGEGCELIVNFNLK